MKKKTTFHCPCGKTVDFSSDYDSYNIGKAQKVTGWFWGMCQYSTGSVWLCPDCYAKAKELAHKLFTVTGTPYYYWTSLIDEEVVDTWLSKNKEKK